MTEHHRVVVVGGGIVGAALLYWLARLGWTESLLLERRELTSGSTWHAAGNTTFFGHYPQVTRLFVNSVKTYLAAEKESAQSVSFHPTGSLRLANTHAELEAYRRLEPAYEELGVPYRIVGPKEIAEIHPLLSTNDLFGAAYTPTDGHVDSSGATTALAKAATARGAAIRRRTPVIDIVPCGRSWCLTTASTTVRAEHVVLAASFWTRELVEKLGINLPLYPLQHHELVTEAVPGLRDLNFEVPTVRDPYAPANIRQEGHGFLCGVYESHPEFWALDGIPQDFGEELLPPQLERLEPHLARVMERLPAFGSVGIKAVHNGPICYTPDGLPLLGPVANHPGLWLASGFSVGIGMGGGSAEYLARWIVTGKPAYDLPAVHPSRFSNDMPKGDCLRAIRQTYARGYELPEPRVLSTCGVLSNETLLNTREEN
ncbi:MAG: NAD(P)/FAD-dependent oxidoreductase [Parvibaculaceae bacterium]